MDILKNLGSAIMHAKESVSQKAQRNAIMNKLTALIKKEKAISDRAFIALGKYYYNNERDTSNAQTEILCREVEDSEKKIEQAKLYLRKIYEQKQDETIIFEENSEEETPVE